MKEIKSITIDKDVLINIEKQAKKENRSFSNMIEQMAIHYLAALESNRPIFLPGYQKSE